MAVEIVSLEERHADSVAQLHIAWLPTQFLGASGQALLRIYYAAIACRQGACGFVALDGQEVVGYICGIWDAGVVKKTLLSGYGLSALYWGALHVLRRPKMIAEMLGRLRATDSGSATSGFELRPLVIAPPYRHTGLSVQLIEWLFNEARERGYLVMHLYCDPSNFSARKLYERVGFLLTQTTSFGGRTRLYYSIHLNRAYNDEC